MSRYFTNYWLNRTWFRNRDLDGEGSMLNYSASNLFLSRGVTSGDHMYMVSVIDGELYLCAKMVVAKVCGKAAAANYLGVQRKELRQARQYVVPDSSTPESYDRKVSLGITKRLRFKSANQSTTLTFESPGNLDRQTLRGVRELYPASAKDLDRLLPALVPYRQLTDSKMPHETIPERSYYEGATQQITVNKYERDPKARKECIRYYGRNCFVCGFDFGLTYGEIAEGFIHVHHLRPLAQIGRRYKLDPIKDLRPVCPNCHATIHMSYPAYSIEEMKDLLKKKR